MTVDLSDFESHLRENLDRQRQLLNAVEFARCLSEGDVNCKFYLPRCTKNELREDFLIQFLYSRIIPYVLNYEDYNLDDEEWIYRAREIYKKAVNKFKLPKIRITKTGKEIIDGSEIGELLLYVFLESDSVIQLVHKMNLKTDPNMPVHGRDAIHMQIIGDEIILHYGESKLYDRVDQAINKAIKDMNEFNNDPDERSFEVHILSSHVDYDKFGKHSETVKHIVKQLVSPYPTDHEIISKVSEMYDIFVGYNWKVLNKSEKRTDIGKYLRIEFDKVHPELVKKVNDNKIDLTKKYVFYFLPFKDVTIFQKLFLKDL